MELKLSHSQPFCKNPRTGSFSSLKALKLKHRSVSVALAAAKGVATTVVPDDFRCRVSREFMRHPVVLATGQDEFTKQVHQGNLGLGGSTDILALALCKHERSRVRGIGDFVTPTAYFQMPRRGGHSHCQEKIKALQTAMSQMKDQFHAMSQQVPHTPQSEYVCEFKHHPKL
ncbi:hypothetical protein RHMOL_Rhmol09G0095300 [Rhododendron molle]|uniref:Uncharacterized protein n=1 Tax=Rhododendron molle TaxID=49168 RepID=A0ACC0MBL6_RHOML|nr:hypothetical protein RHMOL_Rhmol09G0095300 [Rhododendron molle]